MAEKCVTVIRRSGYSTIKETSRERPYRLTKTMIVVEWDNFKERFRRESGHHICNDYYGPVRFSLGPNWRKEIGDAT